MCYRTVVCLSVLSVNFRPMSIVAKRSPISATAEHLLENFQDLYFQCTVLVSSATNLQKVRLLKQCVDECP